MRAIPLLSASAAVLFLLICGASGDESKPSEKPAAKKGPKVELKAEKGKTLGYAVKRSSSSEGSGPQGDFKLNEEIETEYKVEVAEKKEGGEVVLKVGYGSLRIKTSGRGEPWQFDSSKSDAPAGDDAAAGLRDTISKTAMVTVKGGKITSIEGLPEPQRPEGQDREAFRRMRRVSLAGRRSLERDLELILCSAVQGQEMEKAKEYRLERTQESREGRRGGRGRAFGGDRSVDCAFKWEGEEKGAAKFLLAAAVPSLEGDRFRGERKAEGTALLSLQDGLLEKLELKAEIRSRGGDGAGDFRLSTNTTLSITRSRAKETSVSL